MELILRSHAQRSVQNQGILPVLRSLITLEQLVQRCQCIPALSPLRAAE